MRRITYWLLATLSAVVLLVGFDASRQGGLPAGLSASALPGTTTSGGGSSGSAAGSGSGSGGQGSTTKKPTTKKAAATTTVTGAVAQTIWGPVQVRLTLSGRTIAGVRVLQYPHGNGVDLQLNAYALPILMRETTQKQSANIDMVSGATYTSDGYVQSLQSALDQAHL